MNFKIFNLFGSGIGFGTVLQVAPQNITLLMFMTSNVDMPIIARLKHSPAFTRDTIEL